LPVTIVHRRKRSTIRGKRDASRDGVVLAHSNEVKRHRCPVAANSGFSLVEVMVSVSLLAVALGSLSHLFLLSRRANTAARTATMSAMLAGQKMEELRERPWSLPAGGSLQADISGYVERFDGAGRPLPPAATAAALVRRWSIHPLADDPVRSRVLAVRVFSAAGNGPAWPAFMPDEARLLTIATEVDR
jgi:prepilin-type N-terminal cleavage/methylation domain-containing protein